MRRNSKIIVAFTLMCLLCASTSLAQTKRKRGKSYQKGKTEAAEDIKRNIYIVKGYGLPFFNLYSWPSSQDIYQSILKDKYNITIKLIGGCVVDDDIADYIDGYDEVSIAAMESKWGKGILDSVRERANAEYEQKYGEMQREYDKKFMDALKSLPKKNPQ